MGVRMRSAFGWTLPFVLLTAVAAHAAPQAGVSAAVTGEVALTRDDAQIVGRQVASGEEIFLQDEIASGTNSGMQVLLLDETVFTIGPDSAIVIDKFVYDPKTDAGEVSAEVVKGVFRFVTGKVAAKKPSSMNVKLPVGNIGIRGTMVGGVVRPDGSAVVFLLGAGPKNDVGADPGAIEASANGVSEWIRRPGWGVEFFPGEPPRVVRVDPGLIAAVTAQLNDPSGFDKPEGQGTQVVWFNETSSPGEESGETTADGKGNAQVGLELLDEGDEFTDDIDDAIQSSIEESIEMGRQLASINDLLQVPAGIAFYDGAGTLSDGGNYQVTLGVDFDFQTVFADYFDINSPSLNLVGEFTGGFEDFSQGINGNADFQIQGFPIFSGNCSAGCSVDIGAQFFDAASPPQSADSMIQIMQDSGPLMVDGALTDIPLSDFGMGEQGPPEGPPPPQF